MEHEQAMTKRCDGREAARWFPEAGSPPGRKALENMAALLEGFHGVHAVSVAEFFATLHFQQGDIACSGTWRTVAEAVRRRDAARFLNG